MAPHFLLPRPFLSRCSCGGVFCAVRWEITGRLTEASGPCPFEGVRWEKQASSLRCWPWCSLTHLVALPWLQSLLYTTSLGVGTDGSSSASAQLAPLDPSACCNWGMRIALGEVKWGSSSTCASRAMFCVLSLHLVPASRHFPPSTHLFSRMGTSFSPFIQMRGKPPGRVRAGIWMVCRI